MIRLAIVLVLAVAALALTDPRERIGRALLTEGYPRLASLFVNGPDWRGATLYEQGRYAEAAEAFRAARFRGAGYGLGTSLARAGRLDDSAQAFNDALYDDPNDEDARFNLAIVERLLAKAKGQDRDASNPANANALKQKRGGEAPSEVENDVNSTGDGMAGDRDSGREANTPGGSKVSRIGRAEQKNVDDKGGAARGSISSADGAGRTGGSPDANIAELVASRFARVRKSYEAKAVYPSTQWLATLPDDPGVYLRMRFAAERVRRAERGLAVPVGADQW